MTRRFLLLAAAVGASVMVRPAAAAATLFELSAGAGQPARAIAADDFDKIGRTEIETTIFVMGKDKHVVRGVLMRDLAAYAGATGERVTITAVDGYALTIPAADFTAYDAVVATEIDGQPLSAGDRGPAWLIYPVSEHPELADAVYESRMVWQIKSMRFD